MNQKIIVIIDSDKSILEILNMLLCDQYELHLFQTPPDDFLIVLEKIHPDLIILDWLIPGVNTEDLISPIRVVCEPKTKILITSPHHSVKQAFADKPVDALLLKPFEATELTETITELFKNRGEKKHS